MAARKRTTLTPDSLRHALSYDPDTGAFTWRNPSHYKPTLRGREAGHVWRTGAGLAYRQIGIGGRVYYAHRLAWLYMTGEWPPELIDHADRDGLNNRWANIRLANTTQNLANARARTSHHKGIEKHANGRFRVRVSNRHIGYFATEEAAHAAYASAAREQFGEFARPA